ncbi:MAG: Efflux ABC transporter, permease protein, partial [uncultured Thermomicrobiales bacterium]
ERSCPAAALDRGADPSRTAPDRAARREYPDHADRAGGAARLLHRARRAGADDGSPGRFPAAGDAGAGDHRQRDGQPGDRHRLRALLRRAETSGRVAAAAWRPADRQGAGGAGAGDRAGRGPGRDRGDRLRLAAGGRTARRPAARRARHGRVRRDRAGDGRGAARRGDPGRGQRPLPLLPDHQRRGPAARSPPRPPRRSRAPLARRRPHRGAARRADRRCGVPALRPARPRRLGGRRARGRRAHLPLGV